MKNFYLITFIFFLYPSISEAYIGPGMGAGAIAVVLALIGSILLAIFAVLYYPIKRLFKRFKRKKSSQKIE